jgi:hypothetical protein
LLVSNVLSWGLSSSVLSSGMLGSCHFKFFIIISNYSPPGLL